MPESPANPLPAVAIAGCGAVTAVGCGIEALRSALRANTSGLRADDRFNSPRFQSSIVGAVPEMSGTGVSPVRTETHGRDARATTATDDPAFQLATEALRQACIAAHELLSKIPTERLGLVLSTTKANLEALERLSDGRPCSDAARRHLQGDRLAADLAAAHGARGLVQCVSAACVSGLIAIQQGAKLIQRGAVDAVLVVGVDHLSAFVVAGFTALKAIDPMGCRPFDRDRCGLSPGEAGAALVLVRAELAPRAAVKISGWGSSNDANHLTGPSRDGSGLALAIRSALGMAALPPSAIDYVNVHGTGTPYNDAMESLALQSIFGSACPPFSGSKGMLGHTLGAAGVVETILCLLAMEEKILPGSPRLKTVADGVPNSIVREPRPVTKINRVLKLNTGFGGLNGALILEI